MAGIELVNELKDQFNELGKFIPSSELQQFEISLNNVAIGLGQASTAYREFDQAQRSAIQGTTLSRTEFTRMTSDYANSVNKLNLSVANFTKLSVASAKADPFNSALRVKGLTQYASMYGSLTQRVIAGLDNQRRSATYAADAQRLLTLMLARGDYASAHFTQQLINGYKAADSYAEKVQEISTRFQDLTLRTGLVGSSLNVVGGVMKALDTDTGSTIVKIGLLVAAVGAAKLGFSRFYSLIRPAAGAAGTTGAAAAVSAGAAKIAPWSIAALAAGKTLAPTAGLLKRIPWLGAGLTVGASAFSYFNEKDPAKRRDIGARGIGGAAGTLLGGVGGSFVAPGAGTLVGGVAGEVAGENIASGIQKSLANWTGWGGLFKNIKDSFIGGPGETPGTSASNADFAKEWVLKSDSMLRDIKAISEVYGSPEIDQGGNRNRLKAQISLTDQQQGMGLIGPQQSISLRQQVIKSFQDEQGEIFEAQERFFAEKGGKTAENLKQASQIFGVRINEINSEILTQVGGIRRSWMEQMTGGAMGLGSGTFTMPSMPSQKQLYGNHYMQTSGTYGFQQVSSADIKGRSATMPYMQQTSAFNPTIDYVQKTMGGHASGGLIPGHPSNSDNKISAVASGEYVIRSSSVKKYGVGFMNAINSGNSPRSYLPTSVDPSELGSIGRGSHVGSGSMESIVSAPPQISGGLSAHRGQGSPWSIELRASINKAANLISNNIQAARERGDTKAVALFQIGFARMTALSHRANAGNARRGSNGSWILPESVSKEDKDRFNKFQAGVNKPYDIFSAAGKAPSYGDGPLGKHKFFNEVSLGAGHLDSAHSTWGDADWTRSGKHTAAVTRSDGAGAGSFTTRSGGENGSKEVVGAIKQLQSAMTAALNGFMSGLTRT